MTWIGWSWQQSIGPEVRWTHSSKCSCELANLWELRKFSSSNWQVTKRRESIWKKKHNRPLCKEVASILLDDNTGAKRESFLHQRGGGSQRNVIDTMLTIHCSSLVCSHVVNHFGIEQFGIKVTPQTINTTENHVMSFPRTGSSSRSMNTHCYIALQDYFCARFPH